MVPSREEAPTQDASRSWLDHYAAVSKRRPRRGRPRRRRVLIFGHKVAVRTLVIGAVLGVIASAALLAAVMAAS